MKKEEKQQLTYNKDFRDAWKNAWQGIKYGIKSQRNIQIQVVIGVLVAILGFITKLSKMEWMILSISIFLVILAEMLNTAVETTVDLYTEEYHPKAKIAKDVGAGAVVIAVINSTIIGVILFGDKLINIIAMNIK